MIPIVCCVGPKNEEKTQGGRYKGRSMTAFYVRERKCEMIHKCNQRCPQHIDNLTLSNQRCVQWMILCTYHNSLYPAQSYAARELGQNMKPISVGIGCNQTVSCCPFMVLNLETYLFACGIERISPLRSLIVVSSCGTSLLSIPCPAVGRGDVIASSKA